MGSEVSSFVRRYGLAVLLTGLAVLASLLLAPHWSPRHLLLPFYPAVMLSAWFGGFGPGLLTTLLSALAMDYFWLPPTFAFGMREPGDFMGFVLFMGIGLLVSALNARLLRAQRHSDVAAAEIRREIEERRKAEAGAVKLAMLAEELRSSVERYRHHFERNLAGVFRAERDGRMVECSHAFVRLLGASSSAEVLALNARGLFDDPNGWRELVASLAPGVVVSNQELKWQRIDGAALTVLVNVRESDGFIECLAIDITDRKRAEEAERQAMKLRAVADLAAATAHEINNPLTAVLAHLTLLKLEGEPAARVEKALEAGRRIQEIIERMARIDRVEMVAQTSPHVPPMLDIRKSSR
jgi:PAS domain S-box-containing protein